MAGTFKFELVSPERVLFSGDASEVIVPGTDGQFTVLPGHAPFVSSLRPGVLMIKIPSGSRRVYIRGGIAEVEPEGLTILAQHLIDLEAGGVSAEIDAEIKAAEAIIASTKVEDERMAAAETVAQLRSVANR
jgi:F-type H+-transporting ATPase subunit epsilon